MLYRLILRDLCATLLKEADTLAGPAVYTTLAWPRTPEQLPAIYIAAPQDSATSNGAGPPDFTRTASLHLHAIVAAPTAAEAQHAIEQLNEEIEDALMTSRELLSHVTQVASLHTVNDITAEHKHVIATATLIVELDYVETFPRSGPSLRSVSGRLCSL